MIGLTAQYFQDEIANFIVSLLGQDGAKVAGGGMTITMGGLTINVGTKLIGKGGWVGTAAGVLLIILGAVLMAFGLAEITEVVFDYNFIKEWTGISDLAYSNLLRGLSYAATIAVVVYNVVTKYYQLQAQDNLRRALGLTKKEFRELTKLSVNELPGDNNKYFELYDNSGKRVFTADKNAFAESSGNGYIQSKSNPNLRIPVKNGFPQFDSYAQATVNVAGGFTSDRNTNFKIFDQLLADELKMDPSLIDNAWGDYFVDGITSKAVERIRNDFGLTWHEVENGISAQLISSTLHSTYYHGIPHLGGISISKMQDAQRIFNTLRALGH